VNKPQPDKIVLIRKLAQDRAIPRRIGLPPAVRPRRDFLFSPAMCSSKPPVSELAFAPCGSDGIHLRDEEACREGRVLLPPGQAHSIVHAPAKQLLCRRRRRDRYAASRANQTIRFIISKLRI
jgi:hypothetical protein